MRPAGRRVTKRPRHAMANGRSYQPLRRLWGTPSPSSGTLICFGTGDQRLQPVFACGTLGIEHRTPPLRPARNRLAVLGGAGIVVSSWYKAFAGTGIMVIPKTRPKATTNRISLPVSCFPPISALLGWLG